MSAIEEFSRFILILLAAIFFLHVIKGDQWQWLASKFSGAK